MILSKLGKRAVIVSVKNTHSVISWQLRRRVYDAAAVGAVTRRHGIPFLLDACQVRPAVERHILQAMLQVMHTSNCAFLVSLCRVGLAPRV